MFNWKYKCKFGSTYQSWLSVDGRFKLRIRPATVLELSKIKLVEFALSLAHTQWTLLFIHFIVTYLLLQRKSVVLELPLLLLKVFLFFQYFRIIILLYFV